MDLTSAVQAQNGVCPGCGERYQKGDVIRMFDGGSPRHTDCSDPRLEKDIEQP